MESHHYNQINLDKPYLITTFFEVGKEVNIDDLLRAIRKFISPLDTFTVIYTGVNSENNMNVFEVETNNPRDLIYIGMWISTYLLSTKF
jgi:hypothetical protein